jgi:HSP20 family molecular chaperone IbpA
MSLFPRFQEFSPIFRLIDDYDRATRQNSPFSLDTNLRSFSPKFDVKELKDVYELHGELPGIEQKDINIEWTDGNTLTISGRTEHRSESGTPPQGFIEEGEGKENQHEYHKPTVEDEGEGDKKQTAVTKTDSSKKVVKPSEGGTKYWVTERSVGEFHRSFSFPTRVDQDGVKAGLKNGILSIVVPKAQAPKPRKINIE